MNKSQRIYLSPPHMGQAERTLLLEAFDSNWIAPLGPQVDAFERELADTVGIEHVVALSSGTAALHLALQIAGVSAGDEVLVSTLTFSATANAVKYVGATPVFIDSDTSSWNMDPALLAEELDSCVKRGRQPKAVIVVDLYGQCADHDAIGKVCGEFGIPIIEDAAEALGATYQGKPAGAFGDTAVFSFNGNKIVTTSGGGAFVSSNKRSADRARFLSTQAREPVLHYEHKDIGYNYRMSNLLAAVGRGQLKVLADRVHARRANFAYYHDKLHDLPGVEFMPEAAYGTATRWLTCLTIDPGLAGCNRSDVIAALEKENIEARPVWKPMHLQPVFQTCRHRGGAVSERIFERGLCLPSGSALTQADLERIVEVIRGCMIAGA
jgi:dTDP-4-amino-4,6-dideoxygalactose transaminase